MIFGIFLFSFISRMSAQSRTGLDASGPQLKLDGQDFRILSGAIHYFRVPFQYWEDRLTKLKACGLNTVETYVAWNLHEKRPGEYDFTGDLDIRQFVLTAQKLGLKVLFRYLKENLPNSNWNDLKLNHSNSKFNIQQLVQNSNFEF